MFKPVRFSLNGFSTKQIHALCGLGLIENEESEFRKLIHGENN